MYVIGDVWDTDKNKPIIHCISRNLKMGRGFAKQVRDRYPESVESLKKIKLEIGDAYITKHEDGRSIIHLITKELHSHKPTQLDFIISLVSLKTLLEAEGITEVVMPHIGTGLDRLSPTFVEVNLETYLSDKVEYSIYLNEGDKVKTARFHSQLNISTCPTCGAIVDYFSHVTRCHKCRQLLKT